MIADDGIVNIPIRGVRIEFEQQFKIMSLQSQIQKLRTALQGTVDELRYQYSDGWMVRESESDEYKAAVQVLKETE